jgi:heme A synthase
MPRFAKFCWFVLTWTLLVILWGALVRATGSGAGCGNKWPTCNGEIIPQPRQIQTLIEFIHRLLSGSDLLLIFTMLIWGWRVNPKGSPIRKSLVASAALIITEALLGASLVLFGLVTTNQSVTRAAVMAAHLLNTFLLLGSLTLTAWWASGGKPISLKGQGKLPALMGIGLIGVALLGMSGAITALGDTLFPPQSLAHGMAQDADPNTSFLIHLRIYHPLAAILIGTYTLILVIRLLKNNKDNSSLRLRRLLGLLITIQWSAGIINVILLAPIPIQIIHLFIADMIWITFVLLSASIFAISQIQPNYSTSFEVT